MSPGNVSPRLSTFAGSWRGGRTLSLLGEDVAEDILTPGNRSSFSGIEKKKKMQELYS